MDETTTKGKAGRPPYAPTERDRAQVKLMAAMGISELEIALVIGISAPTLRKHFFDELAVGHVEANAKVAHSLFRMATDKDKPNVTAAIFWLKCRSGWKEDPAPGAPIESPGKKVLADRAARGAEQGTSWDGLLQ